MVLHNVCLLVSFTGPPHHPLTGPDCSWGCQVLAPLQTFPHRLTRSLSAAPGAFSGFPGSGDLFCICSLRSPPAQVLTWDRLKFKFQNFLGCTLLPFIFHSTHLGFSLPNFETGADISILEGSCQSKSNCVFHAVCFACFPSPCWFYFCLGLYLIFFITRRITLLCLK